MLACGSDEFVPGLLGVCAQNFIVVRVKSDVVLVDISIKFVSSEYLCDLDQLIIIIFALEERFLLEDHTCKHTSK